MNSSCGRSSSTIRQIVLPVLVVALSQAEIADGRRAIVFAFPRNALADWGLPHDAKVFHTSSAFCGRHRADLLTKGAALCGKIEDAKYCLGPKYGHAFMKGINCKGQRCVLSLDAHGSECLLDLYGIEIGQASSNFNSTTCGLGPKDTDLLHPSKRMHKIRMLGSNTCASLVPSGVNSKVWVECVDGAPILRLQLRFGSRMPSTPYHCEIHPACSEGIHKSWLLCYTSKRDPVPLKLAENELNRGSTFAVNIVMIAFLACMLEIVHRLIW